MGRATFSGDYPKGRKGRKRQKGRVLSFRFFRSSRRFCPFRHLKQPLGFHEAVLPGRSIIAKCADMDLQLWKSGETRDPRVEEVRPGICLGASRRIPAYCRYFGRNIAIRAVCRRFWKNCFRRIGGKRSTDRFWGGYTEILL